MNSRALHASTRLAGHDHDMETDGRRTRGFVAQELIRALRSAPEASAGLLAEDRQRIIDGVDPSAWLEQRQCVRLAAAAHERVCAGDWARFHEIGGASLQQLLELGYRTIVRLGDPEGTFAALSVLWRASFNYGRAIADTDAWGVTIHMIDCPTLSELEGNLHAGWCLGVAHLSGAECAGMELRGRPWADDSDEQVVRLHWRGRPPKRRPTLTPAPTQHVPISKMNARAVG